MCRAVSGLARVRHSRRLEAVAVFLSEIYFAVFFFDEKLKSFITEIGVQQGSSTIKAHL